MGQSKRQTVKYISSGEGLLFDSEDYTTGESIQAAAAYERYLNG